MSVMASALRYGGASTREDLASTPDDGHRYEPIDGMLIVSAAPGRVHQRAALELAVLLRAACPDDLEVLMGPFAVALATIVPADLVGR